MPRAVRVLALSSSLLLLLACSEETKPAGGSGGAAGISTGSGGAAGIAAGSGGATGSGGAAGAGGCDTACNTNGTGYIEIGCAKRFMYGVNYAWDSFGNDFGGYATWSQQGVAGAKATRKAEMQDMKSNGVDTIRWWMFPNFDRNDALKYDTSGVPTGGLGGTAVADIQAALDVAAEVGVHIQLTLFSFDSFKTANPHKLGDYLPDATKRAAVINNWVIPVAQAVAASANKDRMISWDVINEPEWAMSGNDGYGDQDFGGDSTVTPVPFSQMETFVKEVIVALHANSTAPVTVGCAAIKWAKAWTKVNVDYYTFHMYGWVNDWYPYDQPPSSFGVTGKQVNMGEFPLSGLPASSQRSTPAVSYDTFMAKLWELGYAGAQGWAFTEASADFSWSANKASVKAFADTKGCMVRF